MIEQITMPNHRYIAIASIGEKNSLLVDEIIYGFDSLEEVKELTSQLKAEYGDKLVHVTIYKPKWYDKKWIIEEMDYNYYE